MSSATKENPINIKHLVVPEPRRPAYNDFIPARDITMSDWRMIGERAEKLLQEVLYGVPSDHHYLIRLGIIAPDMIQPHVTDTVWEKMKALKEENIGPDDFALGLHYDAEATVIAPRKSKEDNFVSVTPQQLKDRLLTYGTNAAAVFMMLFEYKLIYPNEASLFAVSDEMWDDAKGRINSWKKYNTWGALLHFLAQIKVVAPEKLATLGMEENDWKTLWSKAREALTTHRLEDELVKTACDMALLAASKIQFTPDGVKLTYPQNPLDHETRSSQFPQVRKF